MQRQIRSGSNPSGSSPRTELTAGSDVAASVDPTTEPADVTGEVDSLALRIRDMRRNGLVNRQLAEPSSAAISWSALDQQALELGELSVLQGWRSHFR